MSPLLAKGLSLFSFFPSSPYSHHLPLPTPLRLSLSAQPHQSTQEETPFVAQYLVSSLGFSLDQALKVSTDKNLTALKSQDQPDSVVCFLKEIGFSDSQIGSLISFHPRLLNLSVEKILKPRARALMDAGFAGEILIQFILSNPECLYLKDTLSRLQFWRNFVRGSYDALLKVFQNNRSLISVDIDKNIIPRINLLKEYGLSDKEIVKLITWSPGFLLQGEDFIRWALKQTEELGISRKSNMFLYCLRSISCLKKETLEEKMKLFVEMYGWSYGDVYTAFRKFPTVLALSETNIRSKMEYLIKIAGFEATSIASQAFLIGCSLERKLIPRQNVLSALKAKGLNKKGHNLLNACVLSEKRFLERFVLPFEKVVPDLREKYIADSGQNVPV